jgi:hypothetical protein
MRNIGYASAADKELEEGRTSGASDNVAAVEQLPHFPDPTQARIDAAMTAASSRTYNEMLS